MDTRRFEPWSISGGTVRGALHRRNDRNNQDGFGWRGGDGWLAAVVADGCGSGAATEVGAGVGVQIWLQRLSRALEAGGDPADPRMWDSVAAGTVTSLEALVSAMDARPASRKRLVHDNFLFTLVGFVLTDAHAVTFAIGDGLIAVDDEVIRLGPFPDNRPPYLGYGLLPGVPPPSVRLIHRLPADRVDHVVVGTDGACDLQDGIEPVTQFASACYFRNPDAIRRRLALLGRERTEVDWDTERVVRHSGQLPDDTTVVAARRGRKR